MGVVGSGKETLYDSNDSPVAVLSSDRCSLPADTAGVVSSYAGAASTLSVFLSGSDDSASWTVSIATCDIAGTLSGKTYTVTGISADSGYVDFTAAKQGYSILVKRFHVAKLLQGEQGSPGTPGSPGTNGMDAPRCLGLFDFANRDAIQGMFAGDLVVLHSALANERGIYTYLSTWTKIAVPTSDQVSRCFVFILDAVRQGFGASIEYAAGSTAFETILSNFIFAINLVIGNSIRAGSRFNDAGVEVSASADGAWIGANGKIKGSINDVDADTITPSFAHRYLYSAVGTFNWTVPARVKWLRVTVQGCGGGGGGSGGSSSTASSASAYDGGDAGNGGASSFGSYVSANGGSGGKGATVAAGSGASGPNGSSTDILGGYNGASGTSGMVKSTITNAATTSGTGGGRGAAAGIYASIVESSNAAGSLPKSPTIVNGTYRTTTVAPTGTTTNREYYSAAIAGASASYGGGGGGASGRTSHYKDYEGSYIYPCRGSSGGGGGAGALRQETFKISEVSGQTITVVIGSGGAGGTAGSGGGALGGSGGAGWVLIEW